MNSLSLYRYTKTELEKLLQSLVILCDTREQENKHIIDYFSKRNIQHESMALDVGDYSFYLPENKELGITKNLYFNSQIAVERKNSLEELSGNLAQNRERFENEFLRAGTCKIILLVEGGSYEDIINHKYNTSMNEKSYLASLMTFQFRYRINLFFTSKQYSGSYVYHTFYYYLREYLKGNSHS